MLNKTPYTEKQYGAQLIQHWPIPGKVRTYHSVQFGKITDAVKEIDLTTSSSSSVKPK